MSTGEGANAPGVSASNQPDKRDRSAGCSTDLFGGAIILQLPSTMRDESECYTVPDHQEIFLDEETRQCMIVEVVEHNAVGSADDVCRLYVDDLAQLNEAMGLRNYACEPSEGLDATPALKDRVASSSDSGLQKTSRSMTCRATLDFGPGKEDAEAEFRILIIQLPGCDADVVASLKRGNVPTTSFETDFETMRKTLDILDFSLFGY